MDETRYEQLAKQAFDAVLDLFEDVDPDEADVEESGDVIRILFGGGQVVVMNTQRPVRQIWLAGNARGWHFDYDPDSGRWLDDRGSGEELLATVAKLSRSAGLALTAP